jgi:uncharacterized surface protein with fasciclin (FAS1) repeats
MTHSLTSRRLAAIGLSLIVLVAGCAQEETIDVAAAQAQFCADLEDYLDTIGDYGGLFDDVDLTVGDIKGAADELEPGREAVLESAEVFQEAVAADETAGVTVELVEQESIDAVEQAEDAFAEAADIDDNTPWLEAGTRFTSAAYALEVAWVGLFADAGCIEDEDEADAKQWVSDYVSALQTDLAAAGYYDGRIDGIYGPDTIEAVETLQTDAGLPVTGLVDPATQVALQAALGQRESAQVGALQGILISTGHYSGPVDGIWSEEVEDALKELQTELGVPATGVVDTATLRAFEEALIAAGVPPPTTPPATTPPATSPATTVPEVTTTGAPEPTTTVPVEADGILQILEEAGQFTQLLAAIETAGLTDTLSGSGPFTLFAPTDAAFAALAEPLPADPAALAQILLYHTVEDDLTAFELLELETITTAQGGEIAITIDQGLIVLNGASTVTVANVVGGNGTAHVVNVVLTLPG